MLKKNIFGKYFLELLEFYYEKGVCFKFEKIAIKCINFSEFIKEYLIFLLEKFLDENLKIDERYNIILDCGMSGLDFLLFYGNIWEI